MSTVLDKAEESDVPAPLHASTLRVFAGAALQLGNVERARSALETCITIAREANVLYELALALDLYGDAFGDSEATTESAALLRRLGVERIARPPLSR